MAITTQAQWAQHALRLMKHALVLHPEMIPALIEGGVSYVTNGTYETLTNRRDAARITANLIWQTILGRPYDAHAMRHFFNECGVPAALQEEPPNILEPL